MNQELLMQLIYCKEKYSNEVLTDAISGTDNCIQENYSDHKNVTIDLNRDRCLPHFKKDVVAEVTSAAEIDLLTAQEYNPAYEIGDPMRKM